VAGLTITNISGDPASGIEIQLRGVNSLKGSSSPLILVDGIESDLSTVSPSDVESVDILKDGSSAAIYGTRASNGVVIITTKKATKGQITTEYDSYFSTQQYLKKAPFYTADDYHKLISEGFEYTDYGGSTDFLKEISRTPFSQNHTLSLSGGTDKTTYIASFNYDDRQGMLLKSDYTKSNARVEVTQSFFDDKAKINAGLISSSTKSDPLNRNWAIGKL
jgi:TonB-dependent SusC/RagA subfamily outer membrane receptor